MDDRQTLQLLTKVLTATLFILPIAILPFSAIDPINTPQLALLVISAFTLAGILIVARKTIAWYRYRFLIILLAAFVLNLICVFLFSNANLGLQFYGAFGRNTGLLTYMSLSVILFVAAIVANEDSAKKFTRGLFYVGLSATAYGMMQYLGLDPVPWDNVFSPVIGFLGNPNFQSALLGICGVVVFSNFAQVSANLRDKLLLSFFFSILLFIIIQTNSRQGLLNLLAGIMVVVWIYVKEIGRKKLTHLVTVFIVSIGSLVALGVFNYGPLGVFLYKQSVSTRIFYWEAGLRMTMENPIWGVGLDNYGDWYRRTRTQQAAIEFGPDSVSDVAHNVFLGFSSNGGFPLFLLYLAIVLITIFAIIRVIKRQNCFNLAHSALVGAWVSYQVQSFISINQLSLVFIGWILTGLLIGYDLSTRNQLKPIVTKPVHKGMGSSLPAKFVLAIFVSGALGFAVGAQPMISSIKFRSALESGQVERIKESSKLLPLEPLRIYQVASILRDNKYEKDAIEVLEVGLENFPENYILWRLLNEFPEIPESQRKVIREKMRELDPKNKQI
jgi:O-antigen ligase